MGSARVRPESVRAPQVLGLRTHAPARRPSEAGFSLLEMMIATVILSVIFAQVALVIVSVGRTQRTGERRTDMVDSLRRAIDLIASETRNAGFMIPRYAAVSSVDGGSTSPDRFCVSDSTYFDLPAPGSGAGSSLDGRVSRFSGSSVSALGSTTFTLDTLNVDEFGGDDYVSGKGIIVAQSDGAPSASFPAKGIATHCARIASIDATSRRVTLETLHAIPGGVFSSTSNVIAVPAHVYEIDANTTSLRRNGALLSGLIEDLQIEYWIDSLGSPDGKEDASGAEFPIHDINAMPLATRDSARIRRVRISLIGRPEQREDKPGVQLRPPLGNRAAGQQDGFQRQQLSVCLLPTNLLEPDAYPGIP